MIQSLGLQSELEKILHGCTQPITTCLRKDTVYYNLPFCQIRLAFALRRLGRDWLPSRDDLAGLRATSDVSYLWSPLNSALPSHLGWQRHFSLPQFSSGPLIFAATVPCVAEPLQRV